ncbi:MAG TPA: protease pro-enzyme activation domain-containing protein, partial [Candidatus Sulfotelmatobacter sp.]|nr:protease pro-enzyme activation domain-containing protein [Candidatus Sulfotelmatobacter sp.]
MIPKLGRVLLVLLIFLAPATLTQAQSQSLLTRHVRDVTRTGEAARLANLPPIQTMRLVLVLPLRNQADLDQLLKDLYDPSSPSYRQFLS